MNEIPQVGTQSQAQFRERRRNIRTKVAVAIELCAEGREIPIRAETADLSVGGCYVETAFPLNVGTMLDIRMWIGESRVATKGKVATHHPQFGNGIQFLNMAPEDEVRLEGFLRSVERITLPRL